MKNYVSRQIKLVKFEDNALESCEVSLVDECILKLFINDRLNKEFICLNQNLEDIVLGWLIGKGYIVSRHQISKMDFKSDNHEVYVSLNNEVNNSKNYTNISSVSIKEEWVFDIVKEFLEGTKIHKHTSGTHCAILSKSGKIIYKIEDIGRHNAIDKVIGHIYHEDIDLEDCMLFTSGRISSDLVEKVINAKIPILVSKSVTSAQAADLAKGRLRLICKAWPDSFEIYS